MTRKRILSLLLACLMLLPLLIACSDTPDPGKSGETDGGPTPADRATEPATEYVYPDAVPKTDFGGADFKILQSSEKNWFYVEDQNGEKLNDAVYERNKRLEERFGVSIAEPTTVKWDKLVEMVATLVPAGDDEYDMISQLLQQAERVVSRGVLQNVLTLPYVDIDNPWYTQGLKDAVLDGKLLFLTGDFTLSYTAATVVVYFNKTKWDDYVHTENELYQLVRDGKWTLDRLCGYCLDMYNDVNGNSKRDEDDFYGFAPDYNACVNSFVYGSDLRRIRIIGDSYATYEIVQDMRSEKLIDLYAKLRTLMTECDGAADLVLNGNNSDVFFAGNALFTSISVGQMTTPEMVAMEDDFGVLPIPKWDEDQQEYYTSINNENADVIGVLKTVSDTQKVGAVIEAMSAMSYVDVLPLYCQSVLELRAVRDQESAEMLRMILDTRVMDWETLYAGYGGWVTRQRKLVSGLNAPELVSGIESRIQDVQNEYDATLDAILNLE